MKVICIGYKGCDYDSSEEEECPHKIPHNESGTCHFICNGNGKCTPVPITYYMEEVLKNESDIL